MKGTESMIVAVLILSCLIWTALSPTPGRRTAPSDDTQHDGFSQKRGKRKGDDEPVDPEIEEQPSWTALDDRQVERLLRDSAP
jgi:hypothetical protein